MQSLSLVRGQCLKVRAHFNPIRPVQLISIRTFVHLPQNIRTRPIEEPFKNAINKPSSNTRYGAIQSPYASLVKHSQKYSTGSTGSAPPPPPPPPSDKNAKGKVLLSRISRAFTFSLSSAIVLAAAGVAVLVVYLILSELFLPSGDTRTFNKAVKLVEKNELAQKLLDFKKGSRLRAYGEIPGDNWVRNRPVHGLRSKGQDGKDHLLMKFHVESDSGRHGTVVLEQVDTSFWSSEFAYIALDVPGSKRAYIVEPRFQSKGYVPKLNSGDGFLGLKWGPKKE